MIFEDVTEKENIYGIIRALEEESENGLGNEYEILMEVFKELDKIDNGKTIKGNITDVLEMVSLNYFAKGMKTGVRLDRLLANSASAKE